MLTLYLIRHGEKLATASDPGLTDLGLRQAEKTGKFLRDFPITRIVASPLLRTQLTAQAIAESLCLPIETDARLQERMDFSAYEKLGRRAFYAEWNKVTHQRKLQPKWGDSSFSTGRRVETLMNELESDHDQHIVVVTHGGTIADFLRNVVSEKDLTEIKHVSPGGVSYEFQECSITRLVKQADHYELQTLHITAHLGK